MRHHPKYKDQDYGWFNTLFNEIPEDDQSVAQMKKAMKSVPYEDLCKIPAAVRDAAIKLGPDDSKASHLVHDDLMILWLATLAWRQRNLRECRLGAPETDNLFFAQLPSFIHVAKPKWVEEALEKNPKQCFWQFYFREDETKIG